MCVCYNHGQKLRKGWGASRSKTLEAPWSTAVWIPEIFRQYSCDHSLECPSPVAYWRSTENQVRIWEHTETHIHSHLKIPTIHFLKDMETFIQFNLDYALLSSKKGYWLILDDFAQAFYIIYFFFFFAEWNNVRLRTGKTKNLIWSFCAYLFPYFPYYVPLTYSMFRAQNACLCFNHQGVATFVFPYFTEIISLNQYSW